MIRVAALLAAGAATVLVVAAASLTSPPWLIALALVFWAMIGAAWAWQTRFGRRRQPFDEIRQPLRWWRR